MSDAKMQSLYQRAGRQKVKLAGYLPEINRHSEGDIYLMPEESIRNYTDPSLTAQDDAFDTTLVP